MPIRGHSGVQGGAEVGCAPSPGEAALARWEQVWGFPVPRAKGLTANDQVEASANQVVHFYRAGEPPHATSGLRLAYLVVRTPAGWRFREGRLTLAWTRTG